MKRIASLAYPLAWSALMAAAMACAVSVELFATPTPTFTSTPLQTPTRTARPTWTPHATWTPTITPPAPPDLSHAVILLSDLPSGFEELDPAELGLPDDDLTGEGFGQEAVFAFVNAHPYQLVRGSLHLIPTRSQEKVYDAMIADPQLLLPVFVKTLALGETRDPRVLPGMEDIGDERMGMSLVATFEGIPARVELLFFRRDAVAAMIYSETWAAQRASTSLHDLGLKLDERIQYALEHMPSQLGMSVPAGEPGL